MSNPSKNGLSYYNIDTDIFQDIKIKRLLKTFGAKGFLIYMFILTEIYRDKGCFIEWDINTAFNVSAELDVSENLVTEVVNFCCVVGLFDKELFANEGILTSKSIQYRWEKITKNAKRLINKVSQINERYSVIPEETRKTPEDYRKTPEEMRKTPEEIDKERKERKKRKEKEIDKEKEKKNFSSPPSEFSLSGNYQNKLPIKTLIDQLKAEDYFCEHCMRENSIKTKDELNEYLERFKSHLIAIDDTNKTLKDCKLHFMNWLRINKNIETNNGTTQNKYETVKKLDEPVPEIFYEKVKKLYPQNNFYSKKLFDQYMEYHSYTPEQALKHFERAYLEKIEFPILILRVQSERVKLFKD